MLVNAVQQLSTMASSKQYASAANLLDAVSQLTVHFIDFQNVPKIADLTRTVESVREDLSKQIFEAFEEIGELASGAANPEVRRKRSGSDDSEERSDELRIVVVATVETLASRFLLIVSNTARFASLS